LELFGSTDVLGYLIGKISGMPFERFLKERITGPLGMSDTDFHVPPERPTGWPPATPLARAGGAAGRSGEEPLSGAAELLFRRRGAWSRRRGTI